MTNSENLIELFMNAAEYIEQQMQDGESMDLIGAVDAECDEWEGEIIPLSPWIELYLELDIEGPVDPMNLDPRLQAFAGKEAIDLLHLVAGELSARANRQAERARSAR